MTATEIERLGTRILAAYGMPTHITVLSMAQETIQKRRAQYLEARRIARMWREEESLALWNWPTAQMEHV